MSFFYKSYNKKEGREERERYSEEHARGNVGSSWILLQLHLKQRNSHRSSRSDLETAIYAENSVGVSERERDLWVGELLKITKEAF
jgi:hypothetical protein